MYQVEHDGYGSLYHISIVGMVIVFPPLAFLHIRVKTVLSDIANNIQLTFSLLTHEQKTHDL